jgi:hypothetical protein
LLTNLHPKEHPLTTGFKLEYIDSACSASWHINKLTVIREDGEILLNCTSSTILIKKILELDNN